MRTGAPLRLSDVEVLLLLAALDAYSGAVASALLNQADAVSSSEAEALRYCLAKSRLLHSEFMTAREKFDGRVPGRERVYLRPYLGTPYLPIARGAAVFQARRLRAVSETVPDHLVMDWAAGEIEKLAAKLVVADVRLTVFTANADLPYWGEYHEEAINRAPVPGGLRWRAPVRSSD